MKRIAMVASSTAGSYARAETRMLQEQSARPHAFVQIRRINTALYSVDVWVEDDRTIAGRVVGWVGNLFR